MSRRRTIEVVLCLAVALVVGLTAPQPRGQAQSGRPDHFSIVPINPDAAATLKAQGRAFKYPFPNSVNQGRKFNPVGDLIEPLVTDTEQNVLVIFVEFTDNPPGGPATRLNMSYFDDMLFGTTYDPPEYAPFASLNYPKDRTLKNYYSEVSYGKIDVVTLNMPSAQGWTNVGHPYSYYCSNDNGFGWYPNNAQGLVEDAVKLLDPVIDFSKYAINGEVPNLFVVHAGTGAEWSGDPALIWSHSWSLPEQYTTNDGVVISNYAMMPEVGGNLTGYYGAVTGPYPPTVGVFAHEYGHVLGLPDQYDYGYESDGTGIYSLMAGGSWNRYPNPAIFSGNSPAHLDAWSKYRLGLVTPINVTNSAAALLPPAETDDVIYRMDVPNSGGLEYFLFENRQQVGFDQGLARFGASVHGLAIYHVDDTVFTRNYWRPNEAENWKEFRSEGWRKAWTGETHYAIALVQADDRWDLEHYVYTLAGFANDLYPGPMGIKRFGNDTRPNSSNYYFWAGSVPKFGYSGVTANNITETNGDITVDLSYQPWK